MKMGMYTGLRFKAIIKKEYRKDIKQLMNDFDECWGSCENEVLKSFEIISRSSFIPFGSLCNMPDCWENPDNEEATDGFERYFNEATGLLCFQCSLKNYNNTIEYFINNIASLICEELIHCEVLYEEFSTSTLYELNSNEIKELGYGIEYSDEDDDYYNWYIRKYGEDNNHIRYKNFDFSKDSKYRIHTINSDK